MGGTETEIVRERERDPRKPSLTHQNSRRYNRDMAYVSHEIMLSCGGVATSIGCAMQWTHPKLMSGREGYVRANIMWSGFVCESADGGNVLRMSEDDQGRVVCSAYRPQDHNRRILSASLGQTSDEALNEGKRGPAKSKLTQLLNLEAGLNLPRVLIQRAWYKLLNLPAKAKEHFDQSGVDEQDAAAEMMSEDSKRESSRRKRLVDELREAKKRVAEVEEELRRAL